ncbi:STAS/SEC14 domain-containing protein [Hymenobacter elongatus]|uniref:STAS/SEC14 domain-containing protein n=1 Tax=Hymenobacter elongatus TaxID=877208 RepID=A0A4Z0PSH2_9BACT|nr:STAS/SEC14 domain-containing protein [Hymenobacter elongatus]TGE18953.1 hypothetical protein E5J99_04210 [Hymenobacter elongatus]
MYSSPSLNIQYRPDLDMLAVRWLDALQPGQFEQDYRTIITEGLTHGTPRWLVDVRRRPHPTPSMAEWAANVWLPEVVAALAPRRPRLAYLISPSREEALQASPTLQASMQAASDPHRGYDVAIFNNEGEATQWLLAH